MGARKGLSDSNNRQRMIKTVIFDLGGVIIPLDFARGYRQIGQLCGLKPEEVPKRIAATGLVPLLETGNIGAEQFVQELSAALGLNVTPEQFRQLWSSIFPPYTLIPEALLAGLRRERRLVLLSNTNVLHFEMIRANYALLGQFDAFVLSYEVGALKPARQMFEAAIEKAACRPEECFYTDDAAVNVEAARQAGMDAVQFHNFEQLAAELKQRGIGWGA